MAIPAIIKAVAKEVGKEAIGAGTKAVLGESRAKTLTDEIYNARRRAKRQADRFKGALDWLENPQAKATAQMRKYAQQFTKEELKTLERSYRDLQQKFTATPKEENFNRVLQQARSENIMAESLRRQRGITPRDRAAWERLERSESTSDVAWAYVNKVLSREGVEGARGRATIEDLRRLGGSDDVETAIRNIFEQHFGMSWEEAMQYDSRNMGPEELYELLQYSIATGKPPSAKKYAKVSKSGWYSSPKGKKGKKGKSKK